MTHGKRVVKLLKVDDLFEGMTYCDYAKAPFYCKPHVEMFDKAMKEAGIKSNQKCYFVGEFYNHRYSLKVQKIANITRRLFYQLQSGSGTRLEGRAFAG